MSDPNDGNDPLTALIDESEVAIDASRERDEPPVVARMMIEIRSDGSRTIARGAMEDIESGQTVAIEAHGESPMQLAWSLAKMVVRAPALARTTAKALLPSAPRPARLSRRARVSRLVRRLRRRDGGDDR